MRRTGTGILGMAPRNAWPASWLISWPPGWRPANVRIKIKERETPPMKRLEARVLDPRLGSQWPLPEYATAGSAGMDLRACIDQPLVLRSEERRVGKEGRARRGTQQ